VTDSPSPSDVTAAVDSRPPSALIRCIIIFTMAVAFAMVALIYMRWFAYTEPSSMVIIEADANAAGVIIDIARLRDDGKRNPSVMIELGEQNHYTAKYFLEAGSYEVTAMRGDQRLLDFTVRLLEYRAYRASLVGRIPTTAPAQGSESRSGHSTP
jgi:hypothetical protein